MFQMSRLGSHGLGVCHPSQVIKPEWRNWGNAALPPQQQQPTVNLQHSLPDPKPKLTILKAAQKRVWSEVIPIPFFNPDPIAHLVGHSNEAWVIIDGQETMALIDASTQVSSVSCQFCEELALEIQPLGWLLELEGTEGATIPYLGFMEVNLHIQGIQCYNEDVLLVVIPTMTYSKTVPVVVGSKLIDRALSLIPKGELKKVTTMWRQAHIGAVMSGLLQLSHINSSKTVACSSGTDCNLQRVESWVLKGTDLPVQLECLHHGDSHRSCGWTGCPCQTSTTSSPPNEDSQRVA